jgi:hypothetical protein
MALGMAYSCAAGHHKAAQALRRTRGQCVAANVCSRRGSLQRRPTPKGVVGQTNKRSSASSLLLLRAVSLGACLGWLRGDSCVCSIERKTHSPSTHCTHASTR